MSEEIHNNLIDELDLHPDLSVETLEALYGLVTPDPDMVAELGLSAENMTRHRLDLVYKLPNADFVINNLAALSAELAKKGKTKPAQVKATEAAAKRAEIQAILGEIGGPQAAAVICLANESGYPLGFNAITAIQSESWQNYGFTPPQEPVSTRVLAKTNIRLISERQKMRENGWSEHDLPQFHDYRDFYLVDGDNLNNLSEVLRRLRAPTA